MNDIILIEMKIYIDWDSDIYNGENSFSIYINTDVLRVSLYTSVN